MLGLGSIYQMNRFADKYPKRGFRQRLVKSGVPLGIAQEVQNLFDEKTSPDDYKSVQALIEKNFVHPCFHDKIMFALNEILDGFGVGYLEDKHGEVRAEFVNMGETYAPTIVYNARKGTFHVTSFGHFVESNRL